MLRSSIHKKLEKKNLVAKHFVIYIQISGYEENPDVIPGGEVINNCIFIDNGLLRKNENLEVYNCEIEYNSLV